MVTPTIIPKGWYADASLDGDYCALITGEHIQLNSQLVDLPLFKGAPENVLFLSLGKVGTTLYLAGQGGASGALQLWNSATGKWSAISSTFGVNVCAFWNDHLYVVVGFNQYQVYNLTLGEWSAVIPMALGSQGIRCIDSNGNVVSADSTHGPSPYGLAEFTDTGKYNGKNVAFGQSYVDGAVVSYLDKRQIEKGNDCAVVRLYRKDSKICLVIVHQSPNPQIERAVFYWMDISDLSQFPLEPVPAREPGPDTPPRAEDGKLINLRPFFHSDPSKQPRSGPKHAINQIEQIDGIVYIVKFGVSRAYEMWSFDDNWACLLEDASGEVDNGESAINYFTDARFFPMQMAIGEAHAFISGPHEVVHKDRDTCVELFREPINRKMWLYQVFDSYYWGKDLESVPTIVTVYDNTAGIYNPGRHIELGYYAYQCGGVRWEAYRSDLVYRNGPNSKPLFDDVSRTDRSDFYLLGGPNVTPELSPCVQPVPPHFPPYVPPSPPISDFYKRKVLS